MGRISVVSLSLSLKYKLQVQPYHENCIIAFNNNRFSVVTWSESGTGDSVVMTHVYGEGILTAEQNRCLSTAVGGRGSGLDLAAVDLSGHDALQSVSAFLNFTPTLSSLCFQTSAPLPP